MKSIEIKTTQNVVLQYELADLKDRIIAWLIDFVSTMIVIWLLSLILFPLVLDNTSQLLLSFFMMFLFMFYSLAFEVLNNGQSLGKMAMRIRVIKTSGGRPTFPDFVARWIFRMIDVYFSLGALASILVTSSSKAQRIGDIVANTAVIKLQPQVDLRLADLLAIRSRDSYKPEFLQVRKLQEADVLLIKSALDRYMKYPNSAHQSALYMLSAKIQEVLQLENVKMEPSRFLQTVLNDYVVLTR